MIAMTNKEPLAAAVLMMVVMVSDESLFYHPLFLFCIIKVSFLVSRWSSVPSPTDLSMVICEAWHTKKPMMLMRIWLQKTIGTDGS